MIQRQFFVFMGPPGSGKGTFTDELVRRNKGWVRLSTGELCRKHIKEGTPLGQKIDFAIKSGKLVSDDLVNAMVADWVTQQADDATIILDGFPRTRVQMQLFDQFLKKKFPQAKLEVICFTIADEAVSKRLLGRAVCMNKNCQAIYSLITGSCMVPRREMACDKCEQQLERRNDDTAQTIEDRLKIYHEHEKSMLDFYRQHGYRTHEINTDKKLEEIFSEFKNIVGK